MVVGGSQTSGTKKDPMVSPTTPVNKRVKNGGSVEWRDLVITRYTPYEQPVPSAAIVAKLKSKNPGLITTKHPRNPTKTADHLLKPTCSLRNFGDKAVVIKGAMKAKVRAFAIEITDIE